MSALTLALAAVIGLTLGLLGSGGSIIMLPALVYVAGCDPHDAVAMSLIVVGVVSAVGAWLHRRKGHFHDRAVLLLGGTGIAAAYLGAGLTPMVSSTTLMLLFAGLMAVVGIATLRSASYECGGERCNPVRCLSVGAGVGALTGFLGVGGGFLIVPALVFFAGIDFRKAVGASLGIIAVNSAAGAAGQLRSAVVDWPLTLGFLAVALAGMAAGTRLGERVSRESLRRVFGWFVLLIAAGVVIASLR